MNKTNLQIRIESTKAEGRMARIPFITAGFPTMEKFRQAVRELDANGADIIEIGIPFSDPVADGPIVEEASRRVLAKGLTLPLVMEELTKLIPELKAGIVLMGYYNPFLQYGLNQLVQDASHIGIEGFIVPDLPLEEGKSFQKLLKNKGMDLIALVGPNTPESRLSEYAAESSGYVYVVSVMGVTGVRNNLPPEIEETLARVKKAFRIPVALGFGISHPDQLKNINTPPDALVFGSALLAHIDQGKSAAEFMQRWL